MIKLTCKSPISEFHQRAHYLIIQKQGKFTINELYGEFELMCDETVMFALIRHTVLTVLDGLLNNGLVHIIEDGVYESELNNEIKSTL